MKSSLRGAIERIKNAGFSHIKVELEGQMNRGRNGRCPECLGDGELPCGDCLGSGTVSTGQRTIYGVTEHVECGVCSGNGYSVCAACDGSGRTSRYSENESCRNFMLDYVSKKLYGQTMAERGVSIEHANTNGVSGGTALPFLTYLMFYYDGSVDSECTFTVPIEEVEKVLLFMESFIELGKVASPDGAIDVRGAGMHICLIPSGTGGRYPSNVSLNRAGLRNFTQEVTKLLPALYFVGTAGNRSRSLNCRMPRISEDRKYSAIYTREGTSIEYRVFETCYDRPEAFFDFVKVIANTLRFYTDPNLKVKALGKQFGFNNTTNVAKYYDTPEQLRILNATVKYLKPQDKSFKALKAERGLKYTIKSLSATERVKIANLRQEYQQYKRRHEEIMARPLSPTELSNIDWLMIERGFSRDRAEQEMLARRQRPLVDFKKFLGDNLKKTDFNAVIAV